MITDAQKLDWYRRRVRERLRQLDAARQSAALASRYYLILSPAPTATGADHG